MCGDVGIDVYDDMANPLERMMAKFEQELVGWGWAGKQWLPQQFINYRLQQPQWEKMWAEQNGRCAGCGKTLRGRRRARVAVWALQQLSREDSR